MDYTSLLKELGISYLGAGNNSAKMNRSYENGVYTYCMYLASWDMSGYQVCPGGVNCHRFCLNKSGRNKIQSFLTSGLTSVDVSRIKKTKLFFEDREKFMTLLVHEIGKNKRYAENHGMGFSVRLNGTSDLSPLAFKKGDKNILEIYPEVQFYDYTKVFPRFSQTRDYANYDLTFSFDGYNGEDCRRVLDEGLGRVAVVFDGGVLPKRFCGYDVVDANLSDIRYEDPKGVICGLHYHPTANDFHVENGKHVYVKPDTPFVIKEDDERCEW